MTPEEQMKAIVKAADECWHEWTNSITGYNTTNHKRVHKCKLCGVGGDGHVHLSWRNPFPTDLNEISRLAEKLVWEYKQGYSKTCKTNRYYAKVWAEQGMDNHLGITVFANTPADALREALHQAVKGVG